MTSLPAHRCHDYRELTAAWRSLSKAAGLKMQVLAEVAQAKIYWLETPEKLSGPAIYLSSGVHGDEAAAPWGLLAWARQNIALLRQRAFIIVPCMNPHGLIANTRMDYRGLDINRRFHLARDPICGPWRKMMRNRKLGPGLCLHEDYDAQGCYMYELGMHANSIAPDILARCSQTIPVDPRAKIDRWKAVHGVIRRRGIPTALPGLPEAIVLHQLGCPITMTFETPSEFALDDRVKTHVDFINAALSLTAHLADTARSS